jgi:putative FmdB family regulatory protein
MPFYDYRCEECGETFVVRATIKERQDGLRPRCPLCGSAETRSMIASGQMILRRRDGTPRQPGNGGCCSPGSGRGCCS